VLFYEAQAGIDEAVQIIPITHRSPANLHAALDDLLQETFGFTLAGWRALGHWTADYTCWALVEEGRALANAGVYRMEMRVSGETQAWMQIGAVATRRARRGEGLSRRILDEILARHPNTPFFLFANDSVVDFYPRFGFRRLPDHQPRLALQPRLFQPRQDCGWNSPAGGPGAGEWLAMRKLAADDPAVTRYLNGRAVFSNRLDCANAAPVNWFHLLGEYADCIYEIPALDALIVARQNGERLSLVDVVALRPLAFAELAPCLGFAGVREIRFGFNPDGLGVDYEMVETEEEDATPIFGRGEMQDEGRWMFPLMIRT